MPTAPPKACNQCGATQCDCRRRQNANTRGYNYQWQQASAKHLDTHPECAGCGRTVYRGANKRHPRKGHVDHIRPHHGDPARFWDRSNWQTLCARCHARKSNEER